MEEFNDGDIIIRQGEKQKQFFVIAESIEEQDLFTLTPVVAEGAL